jgi:hypothetical protein
MPNTDRGEETEINSKRGKNILECGRNHKLLITKMFSRLAIIKSDRFKYSIQTEVRTEPRRSSLNPDLLIECNE